MFDDTNLTLISDMDQDRYVFGSHDPLLIDKTKKEAQQYIQLQT